MKALPAGTNCDAAQCGPGIVDAGAAVRAAAAMAPPSNVTTVAEYYNAALDHYFITWVNPEQANLDAGNTPTTAHIMGGAVMGESPEAGVIDAEHRVYGYENLLICDGSVIPANLGVNPSLTITAMAELS